MDSKLVLRASRPITVQVSLYLKLGKLLLVSNTIAAVGVCLTNLLFSGYHSRAKGIVVQIFLQAGCRFAVTQPIVSEVLKEEATSRNTFLISLWKNVCR